MDSKTQIALAFARQYHELVPEASIFWVYASSQTRFAQDYRRIAQEAGLQIAGTSDPDVLQIVTIWLEKLTSPWLMLIDNADDETMFRHIPGGPSTAGAGSLSPQSVLKHIPRCGKGSILVTTRNKLAAVNITGTGSVVEVPPMNSAEASSLLTSKISSSLTPEDIERLTTLLDHIPLALVQAAAYIEGKCIDISTYIEEYESNEKERRELMSIEFTDLQRDLDVHNAVISTWSITFKHIQETDPAASRILSLMSYLDRTDIPKMFIIEENSPRQFDKAMGILKSFAMVTPRENNSHYDVHGLTQLAMRSWTGSRGDEAPHVDALTGILREYISTATNREAATYLSHILAVLRHSEENPERANDIDCAYLRYECNSCLSFTGNSRLRQSMLSAALTVFREALGEGQRETIECTISLAIVTSYLGDYQSALELHHRACDAAKRYLGKTHIATFQGRMSYAWTLFYEGQLTEAEKTGRQILADLDGLRSGDVVAGQTSCLSPDLNTEAPTNATSLEAPYTDVRFQVSQTLIRVLLDQGRYAEAKEVFDSMAGIGDGSSEWDEVKLQLEALIYNSMKQHQEVEVSCRKLLKIQRGYLPERHQYVQVTLDFLGCSLQGQSRYAEALEILGESLQIAQAELGPDDPNTLASLHNYAACFSGLGQHDRAEEFMEKALQGERTRFGESHYRTLKSLRYLGTIYHVQKRYADAEQVFNEVIAKWRLRAEPNTLEISHGLGLLAQSVGEQGRHREAAELELEAAKGLEVVLGKDHEDTLIAWANHAYYLSEQGKHAEALETYQQVLQLRKEALGEEHIDTANSYDDVATQMWNLDRYQEALNPQRKAYDLALKNLGPDDEETKRYKEDLEMILKQIAEQEEVGDALTKVVDQPTYREKDGLSDGKEAPETVATVETDETPSS